MQLRKWWFNKAYMKCDFGKSIKKIYCGNINIPLKSIQIEVEKIKSKDINLLKIRHTGCFSRKLKGTLWESLAMELN